MNTYDIEYTSEDYSASHGTEDAETAEDAVEARIRDFRNWIKEGDWGDGSETVWVHGSIKVTRSDLDDLFEAVEAAKESLGRALAEAALTDAESDNAEQRIIVTIEAAEPDCLDGEDHDWQSPIELVGGIEENPGVWGHGGGVVINEVCMICGAEKATDTWAQDRKTGEQGLTSVKYEEEKHDIAKWLTDQLEHGLIGEDPLDEIEGHTEYVDHAHAYVVEGPYGWWGSVYDTEHDGRDEREVTWHRSRTEARDAIPSEIEADEE